MPTLTITRAGKQLGFTWTYGGESSPKEVTTRAMIQVLVIFYGLPMEETCHRAMCGKMHRGWKSFSSRPIHEQTGAFMAAYWWLLAYGGESDYYEKAAPFSRPVFDSMGEGPWLLMAEQIGLSWTQRMDLLDREPPEKPTPLIRA